MNVVNGHVTIGWLKDAVGHCLLYRTCKVLNGFRVKIVLV